MTYDQCRRSIDLATTPLSQLYRHTAAWIEINITWDDPYDRCSGRRQLWTQFATLSSSSRRSRDWVVVVAAVSRRCRPTTFGRSRPAWSSRDPSRRPAVAATVPRLFYDVAATSARPSATRRPSSDRVPETHLQANTALLTERSIRVVHGWVDPWVGSRFFSFWWVGLSWGHCSKSAGLLSCCWRHFILRIVCFRTT